MGNHNKSIRQALEEAKRFRRNALSQVDADSKDHEQDRQTDAAYAQNMTAFNRNFGGSSGGGGGGHNNGGGGGDGSGCGCLIAIAVVAVLILIVLGG